jgi:hypothetical protein
MQLHLMMQAQVQDELKAKLADRKKSLDEEAEAREQTVAEDWQETAERLPAILQKYRDNLAEVDKDSTPQGQALQKNLKAGIARVEAALQTADLSAEAIASLAEELKSLGLTDAEKQLMEAKKKRREEKERREREDDERLERVAEQRSKGGPEHAAQAQPPADEPMPSDWVNNAIDLKKYPVNVIAERLGLTVDEVKGANPYGADPWPNDLLQKFKDKLGVNSGEELFKKLNRPAQAQPPGDEPMPSDWVNNAIDLKK